MNLKRRKNRYKRGEIVAGAASAVFGGFLGAALGGPLGSAIGSLAGYSIQFAITKISDHSGIALSKREEEKIVIILDHAVRRIKERLEKGDVPREDGFFDDYEGLRSSDKEIFEGVLYAGKSEHEDKKLPFLGNLYANIAFDSSISRAEANQLLNISENLSYRQLCIIQALQILILKKENGSIYLRIMIIIIFQVMIMFHF